MENDAQLLQRYAESRAEDAFAEIVSRHVQLVYSVALRGVGGDIHLAKDVTQTVFMALERKASALARRPVIGGWLHRAARYAAIDVVRAEQRRRTREREAHARLETSPLSSNENDWETLRPLLDEAISQLRASERDAVVMRFFEKCSFAQIGARLNLQEDAARMRVERSLAKLRECLAREGVTSTTAALALLLGNQTAVAVPVGLSTAITSAVVAGAAAAGLAAGAAVWLQLLGPTKGALGIAGVIAAFVVATLLPKYKEHVAAEKTAPVLLAAVSGPDVAVNSAGATKGASFDLPSASLAATDGQDPDSGKETRAASRAVAESKTLSDAQLARREERQKARRDERQDARRWSNARELAVRRLTPLFDTLNLDAARQEQLIQLVANDHQAGIDLATVTARSGVDLSEAPGTYRATNNQLHSQFQDEVKALLGEDGYEAFRVNDLRVRQEAIIEHLQTRLGPNHDSLTANQSAALLEIIKATNNFVVNDELLAGAAGFLEPAQLQGLIVEKERQSAGVKKEPVQRAIQRNFRTPETPPNLGGQGDDDK